MEYVTLSMDTFIDILRDRYEVCFQNGWTTEASDSLFDELLDSIRTFGIDSSASPSSIVDNFCVNGDFVYRDGYNGDWEELCNDAVVYNDQFACLRY